MYIVEAAVGCLLIMREWTYLTNMPSSCLRGGVDEKTNRERQCLALPVPVHPYQKTLPKIRLHHKPQSLNAKPYNPTIHHQH